MKKEERAPKRWYKHVILGSVPNEPNPIFIPQTEQKYVNRKFPGIKVNENVS